LSALLVAMVLWLPASASAWWCEGHQIVALVARQHLTARAAAAVDKLLSENPLDPEQKRFCDGRPADILATDAAWADDMKNVDMTFLWHQIDIPLSDSKGDYMKSCDPIGPLVSRKDRTGCLITAIDYERNILASSWESAGERAKAVRYLVHFFGDLTEPLHVADNADQGGNCTALSFPGEEKPQNLHSVWDGMIVNLDMKKRAQSQAAYARTLDAEFAKRWDDWGKQRIDIVAWAWESHNVARDVTYGLLKPAIPFEKPMREVPKAACEAERAKVANLHIAIGNDYIASATPVIREQLAKAGYRLANLLNQSF
jgi:hypothetical protein